MLYVSIIFRKYHSKTIDKYANFDDNFAMLGPNCVIFFSQLQATNLFAEGLGTFTSAA